MNVLQLILAVMVTVLFGCAPVVEQMGEAQLPASARYAGERELAAGIRNYEDGKYGPAMTNLQASLELGLSNQDVVRAHKYLAFIHCVSERTAKCHAHFRMALTINPSFELEPAEAGHPIWGPVFRSVKSER